MSEIGIAKRIIKKLKENQYQAYLVGGVVRDFVMKKPFSDIDITTQATPPQVMRLFKSVPTGIKYGTVTVLVEDHKFEVTTFRKDGPSKDFRHPDSVIYSEDVKDDVERRDFTMNGLLMDENNQITDLVGGLDDIKNRLIRAIGNPEDRFEEDALRILRAIYFQSKLGFVIEKNTREAMKKKRHLIKEIAVERVHTELLKILKGKFLKIALHTMIECGIDEMLEGLTKGIRYIETLDTMPYIDTFFTISYILNDGVVPKTWPFSNQHRNLYQKASEVALKYPTMADAVGLYTYGLEICLLANKANYYLGKSKHLEKRITETYEQLPIKSETHLALTSDEIMNLINKKAGMWLGQLKKQMVLEVLTGKLSNTKEALTNYCLRKKE